MFGEAALEKKHPLLKQAQDGSETAGGWEADTQQGTSNACVCRLAILGLNDGICLFGATDLAGRGRFLLPHSRPLPEPNPSIANRPQH